MREITLNFSVDGVTTLWKKGFELAVESISTMSLAHEIEHSQTFLPRCVTQATPELL
jgi:hypothetical protein